MLHLNQEIKLGRKALKLPAHLGEYTIQDIILSSVHDFLIIKSVIL